MTKTFGEDIACSAASKYAGAARYYFWFRESKGCGKTTYEQIKPLFFYGCCIL